VCGRGYNGRVEPPLSRETSAEIEEWEVRAWQAMWPAEKADLITSLSVAAREKALASVRDRFPTASPREHFLRLAIETLGLELARRAYPEIDRLDLEE